MRILHTADWHVGISTHGAYDPASGVSSRLIDMQATLGWMVDLAAETKVDIVVIAGDITHHKNLNGPELAVVTNTLQSFGVPVLIVQGNHDMEGHPGRVSTMSSLDSIDDVWTVTVPTVVTIAGHPLKCIPYPSRASLLAMNMPFEEAAARLVEWSGMQGMMPLVGHFSMTGATYQKESQPLLMGTMDFTMPTTLCDTSDLVMLGHIHQPQECNTYTYSGAPMAHDFGDGDSERGVWVYDTEMGTGEFYPNPHNRKFATITLAEGRPANSYDVPIGSFVRVKADRVVAAEERIYLARMCEELDATLVGIHEDVPREIRAQATRLALETTPESIIMAYAESNSVDSKRLYDTYLELKGEVDSEA